MAKLGNLWFELGIKDETQKDIEKIKRQVHERLKGLKVNIDSHYVENVLQNTIEGKSYKINIDPSFADKIKATMGSLEAEGLNLKGVDFSSNIDKLLARLKEVRSEMDVLKVLQRETNNSSKKIEIAADYKKAEKEAESLMRQIQALDNAMSKLNQKGSIVPIRDIADERELKMLSNYYKELEISSKSYAKSQELVSKQLAKQSQGEFKEYISSLTATSDAQKQMSAYYRELEKEMGTAQTAAGSIKMLENELKKLKDTYRSLSETDRNSGIGRSLLTTINNADENLAKINAEMANNAALAKTMGTQYNGLRTQIGMVARELPNFAISISTGIISLSNNLPMLADEISRVRQEVASLRKSGETFTPVYKQILSALVNWQTALIIGVTVLTAYSREIQAWIQGLISGEKNVSKLKESLSNFNQELIKGETNARLLFDALKRTNEGTEGRRKAINNINNEYGKYLPNLLTEKSSIDELDAAYRQITRSIKDSLAARLQSNAINDVAGESIKKQADALEEIRHIAEKKVKGKDDNYFVSMVDDIVDLTETFRKEGYGIEKTVRGVFDKIRYLTNNADLGKGFGDAVRQYVNNYYGYQEELIQIQKKYNPFFNKEEADKDVIKNKAYWEEIKKQADSALEHIDSKQRASLDKGITKGIPKDVIESYKNASEALKEANEQLKVYESPKEKSINYNKLEGDTINAYNALDKAIREGERNIEQTRINLMEEGGEKQLAQLKLNFKKRMDEVKAQTDTYVKLVREQELKEWKQKNPTKKESDFTSKTTDFNTLPQEYQSLIVQQAKLADKEYESNTQKLINNLLKKWGDYGDKRAAIERETESKIEQINSVRNLIGDDVANKAIATVKKQAKEQVDALESESLKLTSFYQKLFGDISSYGNGALDFLIEKTKEVISKLQAPDISSQLKESGKAVIEIDGKDVDITEGDVARLIKRLGELEKTASTRNPFKRLAEGVNEYKKASDKVAKEKALKKSFEAAAEIANGLSQSLSTLQDTLGTIGVNSPELDAVFGGLEKTLNGLSSIDITKPFSIITGGLTAVGGLFQTIFNPRQARLQKVIESSQREVKRLQNAFEDLDRAVDNALGGEVYSISKKQLGNLRKQQAELSKQIQAERDKKKTDQNFIDDAYRQIEELNQQIVDIVENIRESILGGTVQEIANQLGDAFFEAFAQGEDAAEAWGDKVDEIVQGIIRRMLIQKLIEEPVGRILEKYTSKWMDSQGNFLGYDQVMQSALDLGIELKNFGTGLSSIIDALPDDIKNILQTGDEKKQSGLTGEVKNITEDQADIIGSYLNAVRADVSVKRRLLENIAGNILPTISITAQAQLQQLNAIADNTLANASAAKAIQNALDSVITVGNGGRAIRIK